MHCVLLCLGEEHSTYGGKAIPERVQAVIQCRCQCYRIMTEAEKAGIINAFNLLKDHEAQSIYLRGCISVTSDEMIRRRPRKANPRERRSFKYKITLARKSFDVCKKAFVGLHNKYLDSSLSIAQMHRMFVSKNPA